MLQVKTEAVTGTSVPVRGKDRHSRKWLVIALVLAIALAGIGLLALAINWPFTQQALIDVLQERTVRSVTVGRFHITYFPPGCVAERIQFLHRKHKNKQPLITIDKLIIRSSYWGLIAPHKRLSSVRVYGMHVTVPPSDPNGGPNPVMPLTHGGNTGPAFSIGTVVADGAVLDFVQRTPKKPPVRLKIDGLLLDNVGNDQPLNYRARIDNPNPPGIIQSAGKFGTWNEENPASTPVSGWYRLSKANLATYKMISGVLTSTGTFSGSLGSIAVKGSVDVPDFHVYDTAHTRKLQASFNATVAATDGNVNIDTIRAQFDKTTLAISGSVQGQPKEPGKAVSLQVKTIQARVEDLLDLVIEAKQAPMTGDVDADARITLPRGATSFLRDMNIDGHLRITSGFFTNSEIQGDLARVSDSAEHRDHGPTPSPEALRCTLTGNADVRDGIAHLSHVNLTVPGAAADLNGTYNLINYAINMQGQLRTSGSPSALARGFRSMLLRGLTPFLKKKDGRKVLPIKITGNYDHAQVGLDLGAKSK